MGSILDSFAPIQAAISKKNDEGGYGVLHPWHHRLIVDCVDGLLDIEYRGEYELWFDDDSIVTILEDLLRLLASPEVAPRLGTFKYSTDAVLAANGTYDYNIDPLIQGERHYPNLTRLSLAQGQGEHGYKILNSPLLGEDWSEGGALTRLLDRSPRLGWLETPVPPNREFFRGGAHRLQSLDVDAGFGHENFISQLAGCTRFPELRRLVFTDLRQDNLENWRQQTTSFEDYILFFESAVAKRLESIRLLEVSLSPTQIDRLLIIRSTGVTFTQFVEF